MAKNYDPKCNAKPGQMVHIFGKLPEKGKSRPYVILSVLYGGNRFVATPISSVIQKQGFKFLNDGNLANAPIHKFEVFDFDDIEDYKFSFLPHHQNEVKRMLEIYRMIVNEAFNPNNIPLWFERREDKILDYLFELEKLKYMENYKKRFGSEFGDSGNSKEIKVKTKTEEKEVTPVTHKKVSITIEEFTKKLLMYERSARLTLNDMYTLYCRLASYFKFEPMEISEFQRALNKEISQEGRLSRVIYKDGKNPFYKNLKLKFPPNTNFKKLGLETMEI